MSGGTIQTGVNKEIEPTRSTSPLVQECPFPSPPPRGGMQQVCHASLIETMPTAGDTFYIKHNQTRATCSTNSQTNVENKAKRERLNSAGRESSAGGVLCGKRCTLFSLSRKSWRLVLYHCANWGVEFFLVSSVAFISVRSESNDKSWREFRNMNWQIWQADR